MAWSWSHSTNAIDTAKNNLERLPREDLETLYAEWSACVTACEKEGVSPYIDSVVELFDESAYAVALDAAKQLYSEQLVDAIWSHTELLQLCDDGGFQAYVCPYLCHTVSFSEEF